MGFQPACAASLALPGRGKSSLEGRAPEAAAGLPAGGRSG